MDFGDKPLRYPVRVQTPDPLFVRQLQQAIAGLEGEIRLCMPYFIRGSGRPRPDQQTP